VPTSPSAILACAILFASAAPAPAAPANLPTSHGYGAAPLQQLDFWRAPGTVPAPLIVFVHGGGWQRGDKQMDTGAPKIAHWTAQGYAVASINYRLVPAATVEQQAGDVAAATAWLHGRAAQLGIDPSRIVLVGHSAGAHLAALAGTDPRYFAAVGMTLSDVRGVVALDGAAYDVPRQAADAGPLMRHVYAKAFGSEQARQQALSPVLQAAAPNAGAFLLIHIDRDDGRAQAEALGLALRQAGTPAQVVSVTGAGMRGHLDLNATLGQADAPATAVVDTWLRAVLR
jgi:acetyl esterase/lipase